MLNVIGKWCLSCLRSGEKKERETLVGREREERKRKERKEKVFRKIDTFESKVDVALNNVLWKKKIKKYRTRKRSA